MKAFQVASSAIGLLLGLGVARLLGSLVGLVLSRRRVSWRPIAWALALLVTQLQFMWAIHELWEHPMPRWSLGMFLGSIAMPLALYWAAALILPAQGLGKGADLDAWFERDGRFGLPGLSLYFALATAANVALFRDSVWSMASAINAAELALPLVYLRVRDERARTLSTLAFCALSLLALLVFSPPAYAD